MNNTIDLFNKTYGYDADALAVYNWVIEELVGISCEEDLDALTETQQGIFAAVKTEFDADPAVWLEAWANLEDETLL